MQLAVIAFRHSVDAHKGADAGPDALLQAGLTDGLCEEGHKVIGPFHVELTADEEAAYGAWNRIGFANARLAESISEAMREQAFPLLLESNCYAAIGALAGLRKSANSPLRLGMVWIDAHGDCNTPETTLSGMLSGMPVAIATGLCLHRFRKQAGLEFPDRRARRSDGLRARKRPSRAETDRPIRHGNSAGDGCKRRQLSA